LPWRIRELLDLCRLIVLRRNINNLLWPAFTSDHFIPATRKTRKIQAKSFLKYPFVKTRSADKILAVDFQSQ